MRDAAAELDGYLDGAGDDPYALHAELQTTMQDGVGIYRDHVGLQTAAHKLDQLERRGARVKAPVGGRAYNPGWHLCREVRNMLIGRAGRDPLGAAA